MCGGKDVFMNIQAVFFDIDGTLVSFETHHVPDSTRRALEALRARGVRLFLATGRAPTELAFLQKELSISFDGVVALNGQYCMLGERVVYQRPIPTDSLAQLLPYLEESGIACDFVELGYFYLSRITPQVHAVRALLGDTITHEPIDDPRRIFTHDTYQLCAFLDEADEPAFFAHLPGCRSARWNPLFTDVIPADGGKPVGIQKLLDACGIPLAQTMAFGDGGNDKEMLEAVGLGVAMGNAVPAVKAAADYVTADVDSDGILHALQHFGLL